MSFGASPTKVLNPLPKMLILSTFGAALANQGFQPVLLPKMLIFVSLSTFGEGMSTFGGVIAKMLNTLKNERLRRSPCKSRLPRRCSMSTFGKGMSIFGEDAV